MFNSLILFLISGNYYISFPMTMTLNKNNQQQTTKNFPCLTCNRQFCNNRLLTYHKKWECGVKINCPQLDCGKIFSTFNCLRSHLKVMHKTNITTANWYKHFVNINMN